MVDGSVFITRENLVQLALEFFEVANGCSLQTLKEIYQRQNPCPYNFRQNQMFKKRFYNIRCIGRKILFFNWIKNLEKNL